MMQKLRFSEEAFVAMIANEALRLTFLHVRKFVVDGVEKHFAEAASDFEVGKDVRVALAEMIAERKRWNS